MAKKYDLIVVGAGPTGLMAAKVAGENGLKVALIDKKHDIPIDKYNELVRYTGGIKKRELERLMSMPDYQNADDEQKKAMIENTIKAVDKVLKPYVDNFKKSLLMELKQEER